MIDVVDLTGPHRVETVETERGGDTIDVDREGARVYAFLTLTHRAAVFATSG